MKLEVGMYVRLDRNLGIAKIDEYDEENDIYSLDKLIYDDYENETFKLDKDDVIKTSHYLIDLIEVGDYVNGNPICQIKKDEHGRTWIYTDSNYKYGYLEEDIVDVVTKEQFNAMKYIVERTD